LNRSVRAGAVAAALAGAFATPAAAAATGPSLGYYSCYETFQSTSQITGKSDYNSVFTRSFTLHAGGVYDEGLSSGGRWSYSSKRGLRFNGGPFDSDTNFWHVAGRYYSRGVTLPNSQLPNKRQKFTLVLRDLRSNDSDVAPAFKEANKRSFWYCRRR